MRCVYSDHPPQQWSVFLENRFQNMLNAVSPGISSLGDHTHLFGCVHRERFLQILIHTINLNQENLPVTYNDLLPGYDKIPNYVIGDPSYPLTPNCMKEYKTCKTNSEVIFNNILREARDPIECLFASFKARWSIITKKMNLKLENVPVVVMAYFVLRNFCETP